MTLDEIISMWRSDAKIDPHELTDESKRIYDLQAKYLELWTTERLILKTAQLDMKRLELAKQEFLIQGPSKETEKKGWKYPVSGKVIRSDVNMYQAADKQIQEKGFELERQQIKVDALKMIIDSINSRQYVIGGMIKREIWTGGG